MSNPTAQPAADASAAKPAGGGRSLGTKLKIAGFILGVVTAEWVVAYLYLPSSAPAAAPAAPAAHEGEHGEHASEHADAGKHESGGHGAASAAKSAPRGVQQEVDLGEFTVTAYQPVSSSTLFISFHLYGSVSTSMATSWPSGWKTTSIRSATTLS